MPVEMLPLASFLSPSFGELALIGVIALLLYGSDLPEVLRSWGKTYSEFRKQLNGMKNELNDVIYSEPEPTRRLQYYPEFQNDASDADDGAPDDESSVARSAADSEAAAPATDAAAKNDGIRHDTHGAA
jgi:sec-independent protein translocase protein TatA